jgi:hypothetical protein
MSQLEFQITRVAARRWLIWQLSGPFKTPGGHGREYEEIARVVEDDGLFYVELPKWNDEGIEDWDRRPRGWMTKEGAIHSVTHPPKVMAS